MGSVLSTRKRKEIKAAITHMETSRKTSIQRNKTRDNLQMEETALGEMGIEHGAFQKQTKRLAIVEPHIKDSNWIQVSAFC